MPSDADQPSPLNDWMQGDFALVELPLPIILQSRGRAIYKEARVAGVAIISQSCDILRDEKVSPYVQVAPLREATPVLINEVCAKKRHQYAYNPGLASRGFVVDLSVVSTVAKSMVAGWERQIGCCTDSERRDFAEALARHKRRFAFPQGFVDAIAGLNKWIDKNRKAQNPKGELIKAILEIRVHCPNWENESEIDFIVVLNGDPQPAARDAMLEPLKDMFATVTAYPDYGYRLATLGELSAEEYLSSDRLDWDGLSPRN